MNEISKQKEYICWDGEIRAYTKSQLREIDADLTARVEAVIQETIALNPNAQITFEDLKKDQQLSALGRLVPKNCSGNIFIGSTISITPHFAVDVSFLKPLFPKKNLSIFPRPIGLQFTTSMAITIPPFGLLYKAGDVLEIKEIREESGSQPDMLLYSASISFAGKPLSSSTFFIQDEKMACFSLMHIEGKIEIDGEVSLQNGTCFDIDEIMRGNDNVYIKGHLPYTPLFSITKECSEQLSLLTPTCRTAAFPFNPYWND